MAWAVRILLLENRQEDGKVHKKMELDSGGSVFKWKKGADSTNNQLVAFVTVQQKLGTKVFMNF